MQKTVPKGHITSPGKMTIINAGNKLNFYTDIIGIDETLESGKVYNLNVDFQFGTIWLTPTSDFKLPSVVYDFEKPFRQQVLSTLRHKDGNMNIGVLLEGYKGQGKSVIAKQLAIESGLPVVVIGGFIPKIADFQSFLSGIKQDYVLFLDEFEKFFSETDNSDNKFHTQDSWLSLLDGVSGLSHKRLVVMTTNKEVGDKFINRPGRIRYYKKFNFMSKKVFDAIVADKLVNKALQQDLENELDVASCTVDILTTIIEEMNIHDKPYSEFKEFFNHKERTIIYSKFRKERDGTWKWIEELISKKEIGVENEYAHNLVGYSAKILTNDGETIIYEQFDTVNRPSTDNDLEDNNDDDKTEKFMFKLIKQKFEKFDMKCAF